MLFLFLVFRVINLYYCLIIDHRQQTACSFLRPSPLSPVRKALPVGHNSAASWEQRMAAISSLTSVGIKMSRNTSFLQSPSLLHFADSLKGGYLNYMVSSFFRRFFRFIHITAFDGLWHYEFHISEYFGV